MKEVYWTNYFGQKKIRAWPGTYTHSYFTQALAISSIENLAKCKKKKKKLVTKFITEYEYQLTVWPSEAGWIRKTAWIITWPIHLIFVCTIPDCEKPRFKKWFPMTFIMCIIWIGSLSYVVAWMITIIGKLFMWWKLWCKRCFGRDLIFTFNF